MTDDLEEEYPEAAEFIHDAVAEHSEEWVLKNYYAKIYPLGVLMDVPEKEELPFYDEEQHDTLEKEEQTEMYEAWSAYRENLRAASKNDDES